MAASKKYKQVRQREIPKGKNIAQGGNPEQYYYGKIQPGLFASSDQEMVVYFQQKHIRKYDLDRNNSSTESLLKVRRGVKF